MPWQSSVPHAWMSIEATGGNDVVSGVCSIRRASGAGEEQAKATATARRREPDEDGMSDPPGHGETPPAESK